MKELRIHGRGGQGGLTAARIVADAALKSGMHAQAFPEFGPERRGAPVRTYLRIDEEPISVRTPIAMPDTVIVMDSTLLDRPDTVAGIRPGGLLLINSPARPALSLPVATRLAWVDAMGISAGLFGRQIPNTAMLGAWCRVDETVPIEVLEEVIGSWFPANHRAKNIDAMRCAWEAVRVADEPASSDPTSGEDQSTSYVYLDDYPTVALSFPVVGSAGRTGSWRVSDPVFDTARCVRCGRCVSVCPEGVMVLGEKGPEIDLVYCKGCGICVTECPVDAIAFEEAA